jgi:hypothetical protein
MSDGTVGSILILICLILVIADAMNQMTKTKGDSNHGR